MPVLRQGKDLSCSGCSLEAKGKGFIGSHSGSGANGVLLVTDTPLDLVSSYQLERLLKRSGLDPEMFAFDSVVRCKPPHNNITYQGYGAAAITHCVPNLDSTISTLKPRVIVAMGETALQRLGGVSNIMRYRGRVLEHRSGALVIPTLHPRDLLPKRGDDEDEGIRNPPRFTGVVIWDLKKAVNLAEGLRDSFTWKRMPVHYLKDPSVEEFSAFALEYEQALAKDSETRLSWDIETPYKMKKGDEDDFDEADRDKQIIRISFCFRPGYAASVPWSGPYLPVIQRLLRSRGPHVGWNVDGFDVPLVRKNDVEVLGRVEDYMWAFHLWQSDLPKGLEFVTSFFSDLLPWKHLNNEDPALYSAIDADAALRNALGLQQALKSSGQWDLFQSHVVDLDPLLYEAGERGNLIDQAKHEELKEKFLEEKERLIIETQEMVPRELKPRKRYKRDPWPKDAEKHVRVRHPRTWLWEGREFDHVLTEGKVKRCTHCGQEGVKKTDHFKGGKKNPCKVAKAEIEVVKGSVVEWDEILPFNPNSTDQLQAYIRHFKHPMGRNRDTGNDGADSRHLKKLAKRFGEKHPLYKQTIEIHKVSKALSTYVIGFAPDEKGLIHTTYDHTPSTWRLASKNVNLQNVGKRDDNRYALEARDQVIAKPGHQFVAADSSAIEAVMVGWFMGDENYIRLARLGVHDYIACFGLGHRFTQAEFSADHIKQVKAIVGEDVYKRTRNTAKKTVHLTNYGGTPSIMVESEPDFFPTKAVAAQWQQVLFDAVPNLKAWQHEMRVRAHKETFLQSPWTYRHYFYEVFKRDSRTGEVVIGKDANKVVAFLPQNSAAAFGKDNLLIFKSSKWRKYVPANVFVHDGYTLEVPDHLVPEAAEFLIETLTRPIPQMGNLRVGCEVEVGRNWGSGMESWGKVEV